MRKFIFESPFQNRKFLLFVFFLHICLISLAQEKVSLKGRVLSDSAVQMPGVSIQVKGSATGTTTDANGVFSITVDKGATLVFSNLGYLEKQIRADRDNNSLAVTLISSKPSSLNEVVVVSYGTQRRRDVTGSIAQLNVAEVKDMPVSNIGQKLQGKFAGVQINQNSGQPGKELSFRIRGAASINAGNSPLIVIDGFPTESGLASLSPDEIETITVLKDASSSSLYGSRAANGVILVTTKQARTGRKSISFSAFNGIQTVGDRGRPDLMNAPEFATFKKEYYEDAAIFEGYTGGVPAEYQDPSQYQPGDGTDWFDVLLRDALSQNYNLSLTAGTESIKTVANLNYNRQDGVMLNQWAERFTARSNSIFTVNDRVTLGLNLGVIYRNQNITPNLGEGRNIIQVAYLTDPTLNYKNEDGSYPIGFAPPGMFSTPNYYQVLKLAVNREKSLSLIGNAYATVQILDGLKYKLSVNINTDNTIARTFSPSTILGGTTPASSAAGSYNTSNFMSWLVENTLTYNKSINDKHNFEVLAGYTAQKVTRESSGINGSQFPDDNIQWLNVAATRIGTVDANDFSLASFIGRLNYNFEGKYLLSLAYRRDGSSKFGSNTKYGDFPSISAGWVLSDEAFMKNSRKVSLLKIRGSYGKVGNNNIGNYTYLAGVDQSNYVFNNQLVAGSALNGIGNPNLTWETTAGYDIGLDLGLFNGRINFIYDYYWKKTDGLLYAIDIPVQSGFNSVTSNIGRFDFWGHEFTLETINTVGKLKWNTAINVSVDRNKVKQLGTSNAAIGGYQEYWDDNRTAVGHPIGLFYGYINTGVYMTQEEFETQPHNATAMVGTARFADVGGPDGKPDGVIDANDRTWIGNPNPKFSYGMTNTLTYGDLDFSIVVAGTVGNDIADDAYQSTENLDGVFNVRKAVAKRWRSEDNPGEGIYPRTRSGTTADLRNFTSRQVFDGSYLMAKNITLGYTFPIGENSVVKGARIYLSAQNAFTFTNYPGMNPEISFMGLNGLNQGRDFTAFPIARIYSVGVNVNF